MVVQTNMRISSKKSSINYSNANAFTSRPKVHTLNKFSIFSAKKKCQLFHKNMNWQILNQMKAVVLLAYHAFNYTVHFTSSHLTFSGK